MMSKITPWVAAASLGMAACGPLNEGNVSKGFLAVVQAKLSGQGANGGPPPIPVTREQVDANPGAVILVTAYGGNSIASLVRGGANGNRVTWISADNVSITLDQGIIVATRGFPRDLMAAEVTGLKQALAAGGGSARRVHETISDLDQISAELLQCSIVFDGTETLVTLGKSSATRRYKETCAGESTAFTNTYWLDGAGGILRSSQAVAPATGFLQIDRL